MQFRVRQDRWILGLHGLALLRGWPFEDVGEASARMRSMHDLLHGEGDASIFEVLEIEELNHGSAYREWAETYDEPNPLVTMEERAMQAVLAGFSAGTAVDMASGTGRLAAKLVALGHETIAVDTSWAMLERARRNAAGVHLMQGDLLDPPIRPASVDVVTCGLALSHLLTLERAVAGFARLLRPGGSVVISDIHPLAAEAGGQAFFRRADGSRGVTRNQVHWASSYISAARSGGLTVERCIDVPVDRALLTEFGSIEAMEAVLGLPFVSTWVMSKAET
jgi:SAM-dependent methyltransferase